MAEMEANAECMCPPYRPVAGEYPAERKAKVFDLSRWRATRAGQIRAVGVGGAANRRAPTANRLVDLRLSLDHLNALLRAPEDGGGLELNFVGQTSHRQLGDRDQ